MSDFPDLVRRAFDVAGQTGFPLTRQEAGPGRPSGCLPDVGRFLAVLAAGCHGGRIAELGTGAGIGSAWLASAMPADCTLVTAEIDPSRAAAAAALLAGDGRVQVLTGDARELIGGRGPFSLIFADSGVRDATDFAALVSLLVPGGRIVVDDLTPAGALPAGGHPQLEAPGRLFDVTSAAESGRIGRMPSQFDPPSGTRDFLAADIDQREHAFEVLRGVFRSYGFEPLQTPAFERLDVLLGKYGDEGDKLVFKILRRGEHEASGEADLALRYDMTVPLARVAAAYGSQLPTPYKRYAMGPVWRADRPGKDRYREFVQCDLDTLGSASSLADAEILCAQHDALAALGLTEFRILLNSRLALAGLLEAFGVPEDIGSGVLISLDKLDKLAPEEVIAELAGRGLPEVQAAELVGALTAPDSADRVRVALTKTETGSAGLDEIITVLALVGRQIPAGRIAFTPRMVRGLSYYTGPIWELVAEGVAGSIGAGGRYDHLIEQLGGPDVPGTGTSFGVERILALLPGGAPSGRLDVAVTVLGQDFAPAAFGFAATARRAGLRSSVYLGGSGKLGRQLKWASDSGARWCLIFGERERAGAVVTVRDMASGDQAEIPADDLGGYLAGAAAQAG